MKRFFHKIMLMAYAIVMLAFNVNAQVEVELKAFLEGPYNPLQNNMIPYLNALGHLPLEQPYDQAPWHYYGDEEVTAIPNTDVIDWVLVELRQTDSAAFYAVKDSTIARKAGFLLRDGTVTGLDGLSNLLMDVDTALNLYAVVYHRNHLSVISSVHIPYANNKYSYDFSIGANQVYGSNLGHKEISTSVWGKVAADGNADGQISNADKNDVWAPQAGQSGYLQGDFNMDIQVNNADKNDLWDVNPGSGSQVPGWNAGNTPPVAGLQVDPPEGSTNTLFNVDASACSDNETPAHLLYVRFDWENDGTWDTPYSQEKIATHHYTEPGNYTMNMEVIDMGGLTDATDHTMEIVIGVGCEGVDSLVYEGKIYHTVEVGKQCWLKENLDVGTMIDGSLDMSDNGVVEKYCYNNDPTNCNTYGGLYQWDELMQYDTVPGIQGLCPDGWHVPTDDEWKVLEGNVDSRYGVGDTVWEQAVWNGYDAGGALKQVGTTLWHSPNIGATDKFKFTALPGGNRGQVGNFGSINFFALWWSSSSINEDSAWNKGLYYSKIQTKRSEQTKNHGFSIRCLRDYINIPPTTPTNPQPEDGANGVENPNLSWSCSDPNGDIIRYNIYFGENPNPPLHETGWQYPQFSLESLNSNTTYYWRIVAVDMHGDSTSGAEWSFTTGSFVCGMDVTDTRTFSNGEVYPTVLIGNQCWMAKNLNYGVYTPGSVDQSNTGYPERYCYNDAPANCDTYGGLYQWDEMMDYDTIQGTQGICPDGWHVATDGEWNILQGNADSLYLVGDPIWNLTSWHGENVGGSLKEAGTNHWQSPNSGATDQFDFTALGSGYRSFDGGFFDHLEYYCFWWSSSSIDTLKWRRALSYNNPYVFRSHDNKSNGFSVRCLKNPNSNNLSPAMPTNPTPTNEATGIDVSASLTWSCSDPDGDVLLYDIYLETDSVPALIKANHPDTVFSAANMQMNTTYIWKVVAHDVHGNYTAGPLWSFETGGEWSCGDQIIDIDGNQYNTVKIGSQCWMKENLRTTTYSNGTSIPNVTDNTAWSNLTTGAYAWYENNINWRDSYGALYNWFAAIDSNGLCPIGWHVPTNDDWTELTDYIGGAGSPHGNEIKSCRQVNSPLGGGCNTNDHPRWNEHGTCYGTDDYGFSGLPGGHRTYFGNFDNIGNYGSWGSSTESSQIDAWGRRLFYNNSYVFEGGINKRNGFSIRCFREVSLNNQPPDIPLNPTPSDGTSNISIDTILSWSCNDPDGDSLYYNIYFGTDPDPSLIATNHHDTFYVPGTLNYDTTYFWKIVAYDVHGDSTEGPVWEFTTMNYIWTCGDTIIDSRDGQEYPTVEIGNQCWMAQNLNIGNMIDGNQDMTDDGIIEKYCYDNSTSNCDTYGGLYQWDEMMEYGTVTGQDICPDGWHVPTDAEWMILEEEVESTTGVNWNTIGWRGTDAGGNLKETGTTHWSSPNTGATNSSGFTALPGGHRFMGGSFYDVMTDATFWSSSEYGSLGWHRELYYSEAQVRRYFNNKAAGYSVRCLRD